MYEAEEEDDDEEEVEVVNEALDVDEMAQVDKTTWGTEMIIDSSAADANTASDLPPPPSS